MAASAQYFLLLNFTESTGYALTASCCELSAYFKLFNPWIISGDPVHPVHPVPGLLILSYPNGKSQALITFIVLADKRDMREHNKAIHAHRPQEQKLVERLLPLP